MKKHELYNFSGLQRNNKPHVLYALVNKKNDLEANIEEYEAYLFKAKTDLMALKTTIGLFDENYAQQDALKQSSRSKKNIYFKKGESKKILLGILRGCDNEVPTEYLTKEAMIKQGLSINDRDIVINVGKTINYTLRSLEKDNLIVNTSQKGKMLYWEIKRLTD